MNKAVFVTSGTVGSGLACAERFAKEGYDVFITSRNSECAKEAAGGQGWGPRGRFSWLLFDSNIILYYFP